MSSPTLDLQQLLDPAAYPWPVDAVELIETHISLVLLAGDRVVKLKKPVDLGFVDFRDPGSRKRACEDEVRLNRRLASDIYLGVVPITANGVDAPGEPLEWATLMRRMSADRMLDLLLARGEAPDDLAAQLARLLIPFHQSSLPAHPSSSPAHTSSSPAHPSSSRAEPRDRLLPETLEPEARLQTTRDSSTSVGMTKAPSSRAQPRDLLLPEHPSSTNAPSPTVILNEVKDLSRSDMPEPPAAPVNRPIHGRASVHPRGEILHFVQNDKQMGGEPEIELWATRDSSTSVGMTMTSVGMTETCPTDPDVYLSVLTDNLDQVAEVAGDILGGVQLELVDRSMRAFMEAERPWLDARFPAWLGEGHGDLRCEHICLESGGMQIYDCVEFEIAIRCADVASDLAFLLMDLRRLGATTVADDLLERYRVAGFELPQPIVDLYAAHRALVRAKVAALERSGHDSEHDLASSFEAASYLDLATVFACPVEPLLVLVSGLSGSGKSTVAASIGRATGGAVLVSDHARKLLAGIEATDPAAADWHEGIYSDEWTARTYDALLQSATAELARRRTVIVDATFLNNHERDRFVTAARLRDIPAVIVWTELDDERARLRLERRAREQTTPSDATFAIRERQQEQLQQAPLRIPNGACAVTIDTSRDGPASLDPFFTALVELDLVGSLRREQANHHA